MITSKKGLLLISNKEVVKQTPRLLLTVSANAKLGTFKVLTEFHRRNIRTVELFEFEHSGGSISTKTTRRAYIEK